MNQFKENAIESFKLPVLIYEYIHHGGSGQMNPDHNNEEKYETIVAAKEELLKDTRIMEKTSDVKNNMIDYSYQIVDGNGKIVKEFYIPVMTDEEIKK